MFWQFNYQSSEIENLLNKEDVTLFELLNEDDILQECKAQNKKLINFLSKDENIKCLVDLIVDDPDSSLDQKIKYKLPVRACELLTSNVASLNDSLIASPDQIAKLLSFVNQEVELNPLQASLFAKLFQHLTTFQPQQFLELVQSNGTLLDRLLSHIETSAIMDTIIHIASQDLLFSQWLIDNDFLNKLIETFSSSHKREEHENVCCIMVELIKRWRDVNPPPTTSVTHLFATHIQQLEPCARLLDLMLQKPYCESSLASGLTFFIHILTKNPINENVENEMKNENIIKAIDSRWDDLHQLLINPPLGWYCPMLTTCGELKMGGVGRVRLHLVQLTALAYQDCNTTLNNKILQLGTIPVILDLYFEFTWNNFLHSQVEACVRAILSEDKSDLSHNKVIEELLTSYQILEKIVSIFKENEVNRGRSVGHLGHLTSISNCLLQHLKQHQEKTAFVHVDGLKKWDSFVANDLLTINNLNNDQLIAGCNPTVDELNFSQEISTKETRFMRLFGFVEDVFMKEEIDGIEKSGTIKLASNSRDELSINDISSSNALSDPAMSCDVLSGGSADVFEALCNDRYQQQRSSDMFRREDDMFPQHGDEEMFGESVITGEMFSTLKKEITPLDQTEDDEGWANFGESEMQMDEETSHPTSPVIELFAQGQDKERNKKEPINIEDIQNNKPSNANNSISNCPTLTSITGSEEEDDWADFNNFNSTKNDGTSVDS